MTLPGTRNKLLLVVSLCLLTALAYWPVLHWGFVAFDDDDYITNNLHVQDGLTPRGIVWAFSSVHASNWHPITWLSHMTDVQLYGLHPAGHHLTNLILHAVNTALLFLLLTQMTGALWRSAVVAALFALHPTHVESVAWVAERKDVLSTFFALLALWAYVKFAAGKSRTAPNVARFYVVSLLFFALGLMSKPMLVTLPFLLVLLDYWPLRRLQFDFKNPKACLPLVTEKIPFFMLSGISSVATFLVQHSAGATMSTEELPLSGRIANVLVAYVRYLGKLFWPENLAVFYPRPPQWPLGLIAGSGILLLSITALVVRFASSRRYLAVGWFWFLGTLVPVIGLVQVGEQAMADRYTYIPSIGIFIAMVWGVEEMVRPYKPLRMAVGAAVICALAAFSLGTWQQAQYWESTETLFRHTLKVTTDNATAEEALARALSAAGQLDEAEHHSLEALRIIPNFPEARLTYAITLSRQGRSAEARACLTDLLLKTPREPNVIFALAEACTLSGDVAEASRHYQAGLRLAPDDPDALNNLAWIRATQSDPALRSGEDAVRLAQKACELTHYRRPVMIGTLAAAYAEAGQFPDAIATAQKARDLCLAVGQKDLADQNQQLLELYKIGKPFREAPQPSPHS